MIRRIFGMLWTHLRGKKRASTSSAPVREVLSLYLAGGLFLRVVDTECGIISVGPTTEEAIPLLEDAVPVIRSSYRLARMSSDTPERKEEEIAFHKEMTLALMRAINDAVVYFAGWGSVSSDRLPFPRVGSAKTRPNGSAGGSGN